MSVFSSKPRLFLIVFAVVFAFSSTSTAHAKRYFPNLEIDSEQLLAWCEKMEFKGKIKNKTKHKLRKWRWRYCEELLRNKEPIVVIDGPETAQVHSYFSLDASGSTDPEGEALSFSWVQLSGTPAQNVNGLEIAVPQFYVARGSAGEELVFELTVSDGEVTRVETVSVMVPACNDEPGLIFADCFAPAWNGVTAWEFLMDGSNTNYQVESGHNENFIKWQVVDSGSVEHSQVIDIRYTEQSGFNALPRIRPAGVFSAIDMSEYAGGTIQFDIRVLDWGNNNDGLEFKIECFWPCESGYLPLQIETLDEWQHIVISVDELVQSGAVLSNLDIVFQVYPIWDQQAGVHYQLDNIRWSLEPPPDDPGTGEQEIPIDYASWNVVDYTGTTVVTSASDLNALYFSSEWTTGSEVFGVNYQPIPAVNLDGGSFSFDLFIPAAATQTIAAIGVYFYDENWNQAARTWIPLSTLAGDAWNSISFDPFSSSSFDLMDANFNTAAVGYIDILFISAGSVVNGPLDFVMSNVRMIAGDGPGTGGGGNGGNTGGTINPDNWHQYFVSGAPTIDWYPFENNLSLIPRVATYDDNVMYINNLGTSVDVIGGTLNATLEIPEELAGKQIVLQTFFIDESSRYATPGGTNLADFSGLNYIDWSLANISETSFAYIEEGFNLGVVTSVGVQIIFLEELLENEAAITVSGIELIPGEGDGSGGNQPFRNLPVNEGWRVSNEATNLMYSEAGVSFSPVADADQLLFDISSPENFQGKTFTFEIIASQEFIDSGAHLQPIAQLKSGDWPGHWTCWINNGDLRVEGATYSCTLDSLDSLGNPIFDLTAGDLEMQIGLQVYGLPAGTVTIASWGVNLPPQSDIPVDSGWFSPEGVSVEYGPAGVSYSPTESNQQLIYELVGPANYIGATFMMSIAVSQEYLDSGANIQPFALQLYGTFYGNWTCWIGNSELTTSGAEYTCTLDTDTGWNLPEGERLQVGVQAMGENVAGTITISKIDVIYAD